MGGNFDGQTGISSFMALSSFIKGLVGAGSLSLSQQAFNGGVVLFSLFLLLLTYIALWCILRLVDCTEIIMLAEARRAMIMRKFKELIIKRRKQLHTRFSTTSTNLVQPSTTTTSVQQQQQQSTLTTLQHLQKVNDNNNNQQQQQNQQPNQQHNEQHSTTIPIPLKLPSLNRHSTPTNTASTTNNHPPSNYGSTTTTMLDIPDSNTNGIVEDADDIPLTHLDEYLDESVQLFDHYPQFSDDDILPIDKVLIKLPSFTEIGKVSYGWMGGALVNFCIIITQLGSCTAYVIFISGAMSELTSLSHQFWTLMLFLPFILLAFVRNMKALAPMASMGNFVYLYTILVLFYQGFTESCCTPSQELNLWDTSKIPLVFGSLSFALEGIVLCLPLKERMNNPTKFKRVMIFGMCIVFLVYFFIGNLGYLFYGENTRSPVISNLAPNSWLTNSVKIALSISLFFTFAMQLYPVSLFGDSIIDNNWFGFDFNILRQSQLDKDRQKDHHKQQQYKYQQQQQQQLHQQQQQHQQKNDGPISMDEIDDQFEMSLPQSTRLLPLNIYDDEPDEYDILLANKTPRNRSNISTTTISSLTLNPNASLHSHHNNTSLSTTTYQTSLNQQSQQHPTETQFLHSTPQHQPQQTRPRSHSHRSSSFSLSSHSHKDDQHNLIIYTDEQLIPPHQRCLRLFLQNLHRIFTVSICIIIAIAFPQFSLVIALFGSFTNALLAYILPAVFWLRICAYHMTHQKKLQINTPTPTATTTASQQSQFTPTSAATSTPRFHPSQHHNHYNNHHYQQQQQQQQLQQKTIGQQLRHNAVLWFPYDRSGQYNQPPPLSIEFKMSTTNETDSLLHSNQQLYQHQSQQHQTAINVPKFILTEPSWDIKFKTLLFPYLVTVLGSVSSFIGVTAALKDLIKAFGTQ